MIKWTFFFEEGHITSEVTKEHEDVRISEFVDSLEFFLLPGTPIDLYVNPEKIKLISRGIADEIEKAAPTKPLDSTP